MGDALSYLVSHRELRNAQFPTLSRTLSRTYFSQEDIIGLVRVPGLGVVDLMQRVTSHSSAPRFSTWRRNSTPFRSRGMQSRCALQAAAMPAAWPIMAQVVMTRAEDNVA